MKVAIPTAVVTAVLLSFALKGLSFFHMIQWHPVSFIKKSELFRDSSAISHWAVFLLLLCLFAFLFYVVSQFLYFIPVGFLSFVVGLVIAILVEWRIFQLPAELDSFKKLSIPFMVIVIGFSRFVMETAVYHKKASEADNQNKLPYKASMIK